MKLVLDKKNCNFTIFTQLTANKNDQIDLNLCYLSSRTFVVI